MCVVFGAVLIEPPVLMQDGTHRIVVDELLVLYALDDAHDDEPRKLIRCPACSLLAADVHRRKWLVSILAIDQCLAADAVTLVGRLNSNFNRWEDICITFIAFLPFPLSAASFVWSSSVLFCLSPYLQAASIFRSKLLSQHSLPHLPRLPHLLPSWLHR